MKKLGFLLVFLSVFGFGFPAGAQMTSTYKGASVAKQKPSPEDWLTQKGGELLKILNIRVTKTRYLELSRLAKEITNPTEMARLSMGKYWKNLTAEQKAGLQRVFLDYFVVIYGSIAFNFGDANVRVFEKIPSGKDVLLKAKVKVHFTKEDLADIPMNRREDMPDTADALEIMFALRETETGYYIRDAKFQGQSVVMFLRSQLEKQYDALAYDGDELIKSMRKKINERYAAAEKVAAQQKEQEEQKKTEGKSRFKGRT